MFYLSLKAGQTNKVGKKVECTLLYPLSIERLISITAQDNLLKCMEVIAETHL